MHLAQQLGVIPEKIIPYDWEGCTIKAHRAAIRTFLGVHEATLADEEALVEWLCKEVLAEQRQEEALIASLYTRCKEQLIDPPTPDRVRRLVHTAMHRFDERLCATIMQHLSVETRTRLDALLTVAFLEAPAREEKVPALEEAEVEIETAEVPQDPAPPRPQSTLHTLKQDTGPLSLERVLQEIAKLERIHQLGLPGGLFVQVSAKTLDSYRNRIAVEDLQEVRRHPDPPVYPAGCLLLASAAGDRRYPGPTAAGYGPSLEYQGRTARGESLRQRHQKGLRQNEPAVSPGRSGGRQTRWNGSRGGLSGGE